MSRLVTRTIPLPLAFGSRSPEVLRDPLLHDTTDLPAGGIVLDAE